ncbi:MAG: cadmium-translocating P-type ATPase [Firmicutes bacterium HGW-Firmicutes-12]|nr:MAG: cadmium-translocating P-type ATPase [Firmicutes bacterium HGW-Firmicutes-12]
MNNTKEVITCSSGCSCGHDHGKVQNPNRSKDLYNIILVIVLFLIILALELPSKIELTLYALTYLLIGRRIILRAINNIICGKIFDENFLMTIATIGAIAIGKYEEAIAVMLFYRVGQFFEDMAVDKSQRSIQALLDIKASYANLLIEKEFVQVNPEVVKPGDTILIKPGERIPLDGRIIYGESTVDTASLTGETLHRFVKTGDEVLSGFINQGGLMQVEVEKSYNDSTVTKIIELVQNASNKKAEVERTITKFAKYYTPAVIFTAVCLALIPPLFWQLSFHVWLYRALVFLVVSCPCALVISIPLSYFGGIGGAARNGILIKGGNYLEALNKIDTVVFDKTGTLTKGNFTVKDIVPYKNFTSLEVLEYAALAENFSSHPLAKAVLLYYGKNVALEAVEAYEEKAGFGVKIMAGGREILAGNKDWLEAFEVVFDKQKIECTVIHVAIDKEYAGYILVSDELKEGTAETFKTLRTLGVKKLVMLTGDNKEAAINAVGDLELDEIYASLLPHEKVEQLEEILKQERQGSVVFVGDGINDAPVLARADVGVAMGALGSDAAIEAADVVLMTDEPIKLVTAIKIAKRTQKVVWQNIVLALGLKTIILLLGAIGLASMWAAIFADVGVAILAILNAMRLTKTAFVIN